MIADAFIFFERAPERPPYGSERERKYSTGAYYLRASSRKLLVHKKLTGASKGSSGQAPRHLIVFASLAHWRGKPRGIKPLLPSSARQNKNQAFVLPSLYVRSKS